MICFAVYYYNIFFEIIFTLLEEPKEDATLIL